MEGDTGFGEIGIGFIFKIFFRKLAILELVKKSRGEKPDQLLNTIDLSQKKKNNNGRSRGSNPGPRESSRVSEPVGQRRKTTWKFSNVLEFENGLHGYCYCSIPTHLTHNYCQLLSYLTTTCASHSLPVYVCRWEGVGGCHMSPLRLSPAAQRSGLWHVQHHGGWLLVIWSTTQLHTGWYFALQIQSVCWHHERWCELPYPIS